MSLAVLHPDPGTHLLEVTDELLRFARQELAKAGTPLAIAARDAVLADMIEPFTAAIARYFEAFADRALPVVKAEAFAWDPDDIDWDAETAELLAVLEEWLAPLGVAGFQQAIGTLGLTGELDLGAEVPSWIRARLATAIKDINLTTRTALQEMVTEAVERGYSIQHLVRGVPDDGFAGLRGLVESWSRTRATTIALTETATAWNLGTIEGYRASGLVDLVTVLDGVVDAVCAAANGATWTLDEALAAPTAHPRCQRAFAAVVAR